MRKSNCPDAPLQGPIPARDSFGSDWAPKTADTRRMAPLRDTRRMTRFRRAVPWLIAGALCAIAIVGRTYLIQPAEIAHVCDIEPLRLIGPGPWWCDVRSAAIMTYAWGGLRNVAFGLSLLVLLWRRAWLAALTLSVGLVGIVWYTYEPGAVAITIGALVLVRCQARRPSR